MNATIFMALLVLLFALGRRLFDSRWLGMAVPALAALVPSRVHYWGLTPMPDLAAHAAGLLGVYLLLGTSARGSRLRAVAAGLALGWAVSTRPDAALYLLPAASVAAFLWHTGAAERRVAPLAGAAVLGLVVGLAPFLAYNWMAIGNPFRPTQAMEVEEFFAAPPPSRSQSYGLSQGRTSPQVSGGVRLASLGLWRGRTSPQVSGGGLRLSNLPRGLRANLTPLRSTYGELLLVAAAWGALVALIVRPLVFLATVPYMIVAVPFFSCWSRPDVRLLAGVELMLPLLILQGTIGTVEAVRRVADRGHPALSRLLAAAGACLFAIAPVLVPPPHGPTATVALAPAALPTLVWLVAATSAFALLLAVGGGHERARDRVGPILLVGLTALVAWYVVPTLDTRAPFQRPEVERARGTIARTIEPGGVVITTEDVGRPAENLEYHAGVPALYLTDLERWGLSVDDAAARLLSAGLRPYLLLPNEPATARMTESLSHRFAVRQAVSVPASRVWDYFVAAPVRLNVDMALYRIAPRE